MTAGGRARGRGGTGAGLRRFVAPQGAPQQPAAHALARFAGSPRAPRPGEACEMCGEAIADEHPHVVNLESRSLLCTCRGCYLLFTHEGAAGGKYRAVPDRYLYDASFELSDARWDDLQIPVSLAFLFYNSSLGRFAAFYPSPGGATESLLDLESWNDVLRSNPAFAELAPDVEALLLHRGGRGFECYLVPIDACYELVGRVKLRWKGFDWGQEMWDDLDSFLGELRAKSRTVERDRDDG